VILVLFEVVIMLLLLPHKMSKPPYALDRIQPLVYVDELLGVLSDIRVCFIVNEGIPHCLAYYVLDGRINKKLLPGL